MVDEPRDPRGQDDGLEEHEADRGVDRAFDRARPERHDEHDPHEAELGHEVESMFDAAPCACTMAMQPAAEPGDRGRQRERDDARRGRG